VGKKISRGWKWAGRYIRHHFVTHVYLGIRDWHTYLPTLPALAVNPLRVPDRLTGVHFQGSLYRVRGWLSIERAGEAGHNSPADKGQVKQVETPYSLTRRTCLVVEYREVASRSRTEGRKHLNSANEDYIEGQGCTTNPADGSRHRKTGRRRQRGKGKGCGRRDYG